MGSYGLANLHVVPNVACKISRIKRMLNAKGGERYRRICELALESTVAEKDPFQTGYPSRASANDHQTYPSTRRHATRSSLNLNMTFNNLQIHTSVCPRFSAE